MLLQILEAISEAVRIKVVWTYFWQNFYNVNWSNVLLPEYDWSMLFLNFISCKSSFVKHFCQCIKFFTASKFFKVLPLLTEIPSQDMAKECILRQVPLELFFDNYMFQQHSNLCVPTFTTAFKVSWKVSTGVWKQRRISKSVSSPTSTVLHFELWSISVLTSAMAYLATFALDSLYSKINDCLFFLFKRNISFFTIIIVDCHSLSIHFTALSLVGGPFS